MGGRGWYEPNVEARLAALRQRLDPLLDREVGQVQHGMALLAGAVGDVKLVVEVLGVEHAAAAQAAAARLMRRGRRLLRRRGLQDQLVVLGLR